MPFLHRTNEGLSRIVPAPLSRDDSWVPSLSPKGYAAFFSDRRYIFLHGSRKATKSNTAQNMLVQHAFNFDGANVGIITTRGLKGAESSGVWNDLIKPGAMGGIIDQWVDGLGIRYLKEPTMKSDSKMRYLRLNNRHGGSSEIQLHSLERGEAVEKFKDTRFSMIYLVESDSFEDAEVIVRLNEQLRIENVPHEHRRILLDCNPPEDGEDNYLYKAFIEEWDENDPAEMEIVPGVKRAWRVRPSQRLNLNFTVDDNPFISAAEKQEIFDNNAHDPVMLDRYYYGRWTKNNKGGIFQDQFRESFHIVGHYDEADPEHAEVLAPAAECFEFPCGWDMGTATNHAFVLGCKRVVEGRTVFDIIDEHVVIGQNCSIDSFTDPVVSKLTFWEKFMDERHKRKTVQFRHWSDSSSLNYVAAIDGDQAKEVYRASGQRIQLLGVKKGAGSVARRIDLLKRLLFEQRIFVSATCPNVREMLLYLKRGKIKSDVVDPKSPHKHVFDALTYMLGYEVPQELEKTGEQAQGGSRIILTQR